MLHRYEVLPRAPSLGGGWNLKLFEGEVEVGGGVFPVDSSDDAQKGIDWWNGLSEEARARWLSAARSATAADAWLAYLDSEAEADAVEEGEAWLASRG